MTGGFPGPVYAVNPAAAELYGVPCVPSAAALPEPVDLAIIAMLAAAVPGIAEECARRGVKALVVLTAGLDGACLNGLLGICRRHGMRMVGLASSAWPTPGPALTQRSRPAIPSREALASRCSRPAAPASSWSSTCRGSASGSPRSSRWATKTTCPAKTCCCGGRPTRRQSWPCCTWSRSQNPPRFARTARRVGRSMPVLTVIVGRSTTGRRLAGARARATTPLLTRQALFEQAGVIATANLGELLDTAALLAAQPVPAGPRVAVVSDTRGAVVLAADACGDAGLQVASLAGNTQRALRDLLPREATVTGPVDTTLLIGPGTFRQCLEIVGADPGVDAVLALTTTSARGDPVPEVPAARLPVPIAAAVLDQVEVVRLLKSPGGDSAAVPAYAYAESAAHALGHAARYGMWRAILPGNVPELAGVRPDRARELVAEFLARWPAGGWLSLDSTVQLLGCYGVPLADSIGVVTEDNAIAAAARLGGPVALRADVPGLVRARGAGALLIDLHGADEVRRGFRSLREAFGHRLAGVIVKPMVTGGVEVMISVLQEEAACLLVLFGVGGAAADLLADRAARLAPLTDSDADELIRSIRSAALLLGRPGAPAADLARAAGHAVARLPDGRRPAAARRARAEPGFRPPGRRAGRRCPDRLQAAQPADAHLRRLR